MTFLPSFRLPALLFLVALLLGGCCANTPCDCDDAQADAINLRFSDAFTAADLDTIVVQRSPLPFSPTNKVESAVILRTAAQRRDTLRINNTTPFPQVGATKLDGYRYVIQYFTQEPGSKPAARTLLTINDVDLGGRLEGDGCCTCYVNTEKVVNASRPKGTNPPADTTFTIDLKRNPVIDLTK